MRNLLKTLLVLYTSALVACGGGGGSPGVGTGGPASGGTTDTPQALFSTAPSSVTLNSGSTVTYQVGGGFAPYNVASDTPANVSATVSGNTLTLNALQGGNAGVTITDAKGTKISFAILVPLPGSLYTTAPGSLSLVKGSSGIYLIGGGLAPYTVVSASPANVTASVNGNSLALTAVQGGTSAVSVLDLRGDRITVSVSVPLPGALFTTAPDSLTLLNGSTISYQIGGGSAAYSAVSNAPSFVSVSLNGSALTLNALQAGNAAIAVTDSAGQRVIIAVSVPQPGALFTTAPSSVTVAVGMNNTFSIGGGTAPYTAVSSNAAVVTSTTSGTGGALLDIRGIGTGASSVVISDATGKTVSVSVTVPAVGTLLTTAPSGLVLIAGQSGEYLISGGVAPYIVTSSNTSVVSGAISASGKLVITAVSSGAANILVSDAGGRSITTSVTVPAVISPSLFSTAPNSLTIAKDTAGVYLVGGGVAPYSVEAADRRIAIPTVSGTVLTISGVGSGSTSVFIRDAIGAEISKAVTVGGANATGLYTTAPAAFTITKDTNNSFVLGGGVGPYTVVSADTRIVTVTSTSSTLSVFGVATGSAGVTVRDSAGAMLSLTVTVGGNSPVALFTTAPLTLAMGAGTSETFQVFGGVMPYLVASSDSRVAAAVVNSSALTVSAVNKGTATIQITDAAGKTIALTVNVDGGTTGSGNVAAIEILTSSTTLSSAQGSKLTFIVTAKDRLNNAVPAQPISFSASSGTLTGANPTPVTDASGAVTSVVLTPGADQSNRNITLTASVGSVFKTITVPVVKTTLSLSGAGSLLSDAGPKPYSVTALDSSGNPIAGAALTFSATAGAVSPQSVTTDSSGSVTVNFTPPNATGDVTFTVIGLGTTTQRVIQVSAENFAFIAPTIAQTLTVQTPNAVTVRYLSGGVGVAGRNVTFSTTRGTLTSTMAITDSQGYASTSISSTTAGPVTVSSQSGTASTSQTASFIAVTPASIVLQANPGAVLPNTTNTTANASSLSATVRDLTGNPVAGKVVNFTAIVDGSNGSISPGSSTTDVDGVAKVQFVPGALSTGTNGVKIRATVQGTGLFYDASLTVNGEALFISIGIANVLGVPDNVTYEKELQVYVTDANGTAVGNKSIVLSVLPTYYLKGILSTPQAWTYERNTDGSLKVLTCPNEDLTYPEGDSRRADGILQVGEDTNGDGRLQPGNPAVISSGTVVTNSTGFAKFTIRYGKNYALWLNAVVEARALVGGTESSAQTEFLLPMTTADAEAKAAPANAVSPFGTVQSCSSPN